MAKITEFTNANVKVLQEQMQAALQPLAEQLGLEIAIGGGRFTNGQASLRFECRPREVSEAVSRYNGTTARIYGLPEDVVGTQFSFRGTLYRVDGIDPSRPKKSIDLTRLRDGAKLRCAPNLVRAGLQSANGHVA